MRLVCSWGGVGTTAFLEFLAGIDGYESNPPHGFINPLKHPLQPPKGAQKAVFLFGCPYTSLVSLFRRGYDRLHYMNVNSLFPAEVVYPDGNLWELTVQRFGLRELRTNVWVDGEGVYADQCGALEWLAERKTKRARAEQLVESVSRRAYRDFDDFLKRGQDLFRRTEQWENWQSQAEYPVMLVRYEKLWENLGQVLSFLDIEPELWGRFPEQRQRQSTLDGLTEGQRSLLGDLYGELKEAVDRAPDIRRIPE